MRIGELAEQAGVSPRMLRHYEALGLIEARRRENGYRDYDDLDARLLREIRSLLRLGFALEDTRPFIDCLRAGNLSAVSCPDSVAAYRRKLAEVDAYLVRLHEVRDELTGQVERAVAERAQPPEPRCEFSRNTES